MVAVIIPWRPQASRIPALDAVLEWYRESMPNVEVHLVDSADAVFNLAEARNSGVASIADPDEVVIVNDADTIPILEPLAAAIDEAAHSGMVHLPYTAYHWLGSAGTAHVMAGGSLEDAGYELVKGACSGVYVTTPRTWAAHGGQDERFRGWGFEDAAWYLAHETLLGEPPRRHVGTVFALHHEAARREGEQYDANAAHMERYRSASGNRDLMAQLVGRGRASLAKALALPGS